MARGKWCWDSTANELKFEKTGSSLFHRLPVYKTVSPHQASTDSNEVVSLNDIKEVAVQLLNSKLLHAMHIKSVQLFDLCYKTDTMDRFLRQVIEYFHWYLKYQSASQDEALDTHGVVGDAARKGLKLATDKFEVAKSNLSAAYIALIAGLGVDFSHHSLQGRLRFSRTLTDQYLYEAIYEFTLLVAWITFGYQYWDTIHAVIGSLLRTTAFNKDINMPVMSSVSQDEECDHDLKKVSKNEKTNEHLSWKVKYDRPACGKLPRIKSPIMTVLYPSTNEESTKTTVIPEDGITSCCVGIIGQPKSNFDPKTLKPISSSAVLSSKEESSSDSDESGSDDLSDL